MGGGLVVVTLFFGCSDERAPIPEAGVAVDAAVSDSVEAGVPDDVSIDAPTGDGYVDLFDVIPLGDAGCPACIRDRCGAQINACFNNPACATGLLCTLQMCATGLLGDGGFNPANIACVLGCFNGDQATAFMAIGALQCLTMTCASVCNLDAGVPPNPDGQTQPDARADAPAADTAEPETGSTSDSGDNADADDAVPGSDVTPESGGELDTSPPTDVTAEAAPPGEGGTAD
jgi:hypothetical protein